MQKKLEIGQIVNTHGIKGEIKVTPFTNDITRFDDLKENAFIEGICPNCGGKLVERQSRFGTFWGCSNYPHCRFTASPDPQTGEIKMKA